MSRRQHPFDLAGAHAVSTFADIRASSPEPPDFARFCRLARVNDLVSRMVPASPTDLDPRVAEHHLYLLFAMYRFWCANQRTLIVDRTALEHLFHGIPNRMPSVPHGACYVTLPEFWFWGRIDPEEPPEPLDGMFLVADRDESWLTVVAALGIRPQRSGFSQVVVGGDEKLLRAATDCLREPPFHADFEGGEAAGYRSCVSEAELLHLARLALHAAAE